MTAIPATKDALLAMSAEELSTLMILVDSDEIAVKMLATTQATQLSKDCTDYVLQFWEQHGRDPSLQEFALVRAQLIQKHLREGPSRDAIIIDELAEQALFSDTGGKEEAQR